MKRNIFGVRFVTFFVISTVLIGVVWATNYAYDGDVSHDVKRDRIIAIAEDYDTLYYYCDSSNLQSYSGVTYFDTTVGWRTGMEYCWGGEDSIREYLLRMTEGDGAGNINTGGSSSYDTYAAGTDCSGFVSNAWTSPRRVTASFPGISDDIDWDDLRMGDALNYPSHHIRLFDYFTDDTHTSMLYENTAGGGVIWQMVHRSLSRDDNYPPIRYNDPGDYKVYDFPEPTITYITRSGIERVEIRWDGQADQGFKIYISSDGTSWGLIRDYNELTPPERVCGVSGLLPDHTYYFKATSLNTSETEDSDVVAYRLDGALAHRLLLVDGSDRYREQHGSNHTILVRVGKALSSRGIGYDFCSNEAVVDEQIDLGDYEAVVWTVSEDSTFDETFSWAEQMHLQNFLDGGGHLFVSGAEIGWDIDEYADTSNGYKNGSPNDELFYNNYLLADYVEDDAGTYHIQGSAGTIFDGMDFYFDDGSHGTYDVVYPDTMSAVGGGTVGLVYIGGLGGNACVYGTSGAGSVVNFGIPYETIYPEATRFSVMKAILNYFDVNVEPPTVKSAVQTAADEVTINWASYASEGFRLLQKTGSGSWTQIQNESTLGTDATSATVSGLSTGVRYAFKVQAVNTGGPSMDSDVVVCSLGSSGHKILIVDGYDRWNTQSGGTSHTLLENFADALTANLVRYDSCTNESVVEGDISLSSYTIVMWMCGEESTESETIGYNEQVLIQDYLKDGGYIFVSGAEIGWDLVDEADTSNNYSNGNPNDTPFYNNYLKADYVADDAGTYSVTGVSSTDFDGLSFNFDDGTHGTYDVNYPDVISGYGGSVSGLYYSSGPNVAGVTFTGIVSGGTSEAKIIHFGFPFETIYDLTSRTNVMAAILNYFGSLGVSNWEYY